MELCGVSAEGQRTFSLYNVRQNAWCSSAVRTRLLTNGVDQNRTMEGMDGKWCSISMGIYSSLSFSHLNTTPRKSTCGIVFSSGASALTHEWFFSAFSHRPEIYYVPVTAQACWFLLLDHRNMTVRLFFLPLHNISILYDIWYMRYNPQWVPPERLKRMNTYPRLSCKGWIWFSVREKEETRWLKSGSLPSLFLVFCSR